MPRRYATSLQSLFHRRYASLKSSPWKPVSRYISYCYGDSYTHQYIVRSSAMSNQVVLITGGLTGIGRAAAVAFARKGAKVVVAGRRDEAGKALVKELRSFGSEAEFINADVRKEDDVRALVDKTVGRFGRLDVAVNNAATEGQVGPITDQTAESYAATFDTNVLGVVLSMKHEVRAMQAQGRGNIQSAGERALKRLALTEAISHLNQGLELETD